MTKIPGTTTRKAPPGRQLVLPSETIALARAAIEAAQARDIDPEWVVLFNDNSKPSAGTKGRLGVAIDTSPKKLYYDDGSSWVLIGQLQGYVEKALFDANTILKADSDDTPAALSIPEQRVVGRITGGSITALTVAQLQTLLLSAAFPENVSFQFDAALSADGKWCGFTWNGTAGAALSFGQAVYQASADDKWKLAKADTEATTKGRIGICVKAANGDGDDTEVLYFGVVRADAQFPSFTKYAPVFLSATTAGAVSSSAPTKATGHCIRIIGHAESANTLFVNPENGWDEYA